MKWRNNLVLLVILCILGSWYYYYEIRGKDQREHTAREQQRIFPGIDPLNLTSFEFARITSVDDPSIEFTEENAARFRFERAGHSWRIVKPLSTAADLSRIDEIVKEIVELSRDRVIAEVAEDLHPFGLVKPAFVISFEAGNQRHELRLGDENPTAEFFYC